ncbi:putative mRNA 3'-end-processing protein YTH1 (putative) [Pseudozyma hubeiensis]|nr:putative mRNA 3'-end-processing protein YTH1 (putative) [Pseudozyma hubeiensis]
MASTSEEERLKAEIAKLSGAIHTHKQHQQQPYHSYAAGYASRGRGHYAGGGSSYRGAYVGGRGGHQPSASFGRGRGRGAAVAAPQRNRTLILNGSNKAATTAPADGSVGDSTTSQGAASTSLTAAAVPSGSNPASGPSTTDGWIKRKSTHNMSLVSTSTFQRTEPARLAAMEATRKAKAEAKAAATSTAVAGKKAIRSKPAKPSASVRRGDNMGEVVIDGVVFEFDPSGTKLVKKPIQPSSSDISEHPAPSSSTTTTGTSTAVPLKTSINGQDYIRTKRGNLISADLLAKRKAQREAQAKMGRLDKMVGQISTIQATRNSSRKAGEGSRTLDAKKARTLCTFFNKTGQCKRGLSCPYLHDSSKIALCPKVLRPTGCTLPKGTCPLSHMVRAERVPHCVHYLRSGKCRNGEECLYTHADLTDGSRTRICRDFSDYGWCERGKLCEQRHTYECPDFVEKGKCERKGCKLVHVIRADQSLDRGEDGDGDGVQDGDLFVRDDAAAEEASDAETEMQSGTKRKRPLMQTELDDDQPVLPDDDADGEVEDEQVNFANVGENRSTKRRKGKAFTQQKDFISFDDDQDGGDQDEEDESEDSEENEDDEDEMEEAGSVHSEDFELSDEEDEDEDEDDHVAEDKTSADEPIAAQADDDDDDDLVDRDL